ncbi:MAG: hypothetical protein U0S49_10790 [Rhodospirillales bacterium]|nr:hypothetical protein [Rhodospirillales bacterium]
MRRFGIGRAGEGPRERQPILVPAGCGTTFDCGPLRAAGLYNRSRCR